jgi:septation ring formation regulator EzrA
MENKTMVLLLESYKKMHKNMVATQKHEMGKKIKELEAKLFNTNLYLKDFEE